LCGEREKGKSKRREERRKIIEKNIDEFAYIVVIMLRLQLLQQFISMESSF
jgi:hypothetical protein